MKTTIKKSLRATFKTLYFFLYFMFTIKERNAYLYSVKNDVEVLNREDDAFGHTYTLGKRLNGKEPTRYFLTWKEFRELHKF
jgi:hypothetical protein